MPAISPTCGYCPRRHKGVTIQNHLPSKKPSGLILIGEKPGAVEVRKREVFVGESGYVLRSAFENVGIDIDRVYITNVMQCGLPYGRQSDKEEEKEIVNCCSKVLKDTLLNFEDDLNSYDVDRQIICCLGGVALNAVAGLIGVMKYRGTFNRVGRRLVTSTINPALLLRQEKSKPVFDLLCADLLKAHQYCVGDRELFDRPKFANDYRACKSILLEALNNKAMLTIDVETDDVNPWTCKLTAVGVGVSDRAATIVCPSVNRDFYKEGEYRKLIRLLKKILTNKSCKVLYHNMTFDDIVLGRILKINIEAEKHDTVIGHHAVWPKTPHDLQNAVSHFELIRPWKTQFDIVKSTKMIRTSKNVFKEFVSYNTSDVYYTSVLNNHLDVAIEREGLEKVYENDRKMAAIGADWSRVGVLIDEDRRAKLQGQYEIELSDMFDAIEGMTFEGFNPRSHKQRADVMIKHFGILPSRRTATGQICTDSKSLFEFRDHPFIKILTKYLKLHKLYSTYVKNLPAKIESDGRLHPIFNITATPTGRFGTSPAIQNWPYSMRPMLIAPDGYVWITADYKALELRIIAMLSGIQELIDQLIAGDVHLYNAQHVYFAAIWDKCDKDKQAALRKLGKCITFGDNYMAGVQTLLDTAHKEYPDLTYDEVELMQKALRTKYWQKVEYAKTVQALANKNYELFTPWLGRRKRWPLGNVADTEASNFPVQGGAGDIAGEAAIRWVDRLKMKGDYHTRVFPNIQIHDAYYAYVKEDYALEAVKDLRECMYCEKDVISYVDGKKYHMIFDVDCHIGKSLGKDDLKEVKQ